jgi:thiamine biosynthesis lipoprotein
VVSETCTFADGLATAVMVLGREKGMDLVEGLDGVECLIVVEGNAGGFEDYFSKGFNRRVYGMAETRQLQCYRA